MRAVKLEVVQSAVWRCALKLDFGSAAATVAYSIMTSRLTGFALDVADFFSMDGIWCISTC